MTSLIVHRHNVDTHIVLRAALLKYFTKQIGISKRKFFRETTKESSSNTRVSSSRRFTFHVSMVRRDLFLCSDFLRFARQAPFAPFIAAYLQQAVKNKFSKFEHAQVRDKI